MEVEYLFIVLKIWHGSRIPIYSLKGEAWK